MPSIPVSLPSVLRMFASRPGLALARLLTITLVVSAIGAVLAVADATLFRPLPFPGSPEILRVTLQPPGTTARRDAVPLYPVVFDQLRTSAADAAALAGIWAEDRAVAGNGEPEAVRAGRVSPGFFELLGAQPMLGRLIAPGDAADRAKVVVLSHGLWMRRFGGDRTIVGRTMLVDREAHAIIGVMPAGFEPAYSGTEFWTPLPQSTTTPPLLFTSIQTIARPRPGITITQLREALEARMSPARDALPGVLKGWTVSVRDLRDAQFGDRRPAVLVLLGAVLVLTLIAVGNLTNLTLADVASRRGEFALKAALGASRVDLAAPDIAQALVLGVAGAAAGLLAAAWLAPALLAMDPSAALSGLAVAVDWRVGVGGAIASVTIMLASMALPALRLGSPRLASDLAAGQTRSTGSRAARRARLLLVGLQTALALALLAGGGLVVSSLYAASRVDPGFNAERVITAQVQLSPAVFPTPLDRAVFVDQILEQLRATPDVVSAGTTLNPFNGGSFTTGVTIEGQTTADGSGPVVQFRRVSPGYLETMAIPLHAGRAFDRRDWIDGAPVAIVSRGFATRFWPGEDPIGKRVKRGPATAPWLVVVGVAGDVRDIAAGQPPADTLYTPYYQGSSPATPVGVVVRTKGDPATAIDAVKRAVWAIDAKQPLSNIRTLDDFLSASVGQQRFRALLLTICGVLGLVLATVGVYGVTTRAVVERTREAGIRIALGARPSAVRWTVAWSTLRAVVAGAVTGGAVAALTREGVSALLPEVDGSVWAFSAAGAVVLFLAAGVAAVIASRSITRVEPLHALRSR